MVSQIRPKTTVLVYNNAYVLTFPYILHACYMYMHVHVLCSDHVRLPRAPGEVDWFDHVPVLETVLHHATVEGVVELPVDGLEVSVAVGVGLLVSGHVVQHHLELWRVQKKGFNINFPLYTMKILKFKSPRGF